MNQHKASNGASVQLYSNGRMTFRRDSPICVNGLEAFWVQAAREFFQAERDQELGRWRDPENPDYVIYPDKNNRHIQQPAVIIINEKTGGFAMCGKDDTVSSSGIGTETNINVWRLLAKHYFAAHSEKKPWHDAQHGEVWVITVVGEELLCRSNSDGDFIPVFGHHHWVTISNGSCAITAGRRIWPEGGDNQ